MRSVMLRKFLLTEWSCAATRSLREDQALLLRRRLPLVPRAASPHGGNLVAAVRSLFKRSNKRLTQKVSFFVYKDSI